MDFFDRQDRARRQTRWLVVGFGLAVVLTVLAVYLVLALVFLHKGLARGGLAVLWHPPLFAGATLGTVLVIALGSLAKILELGRGGPAVAEMLGGTPVNPNTRDPRERKLLNVVEEMALASGLPVPQVYLLRREPGINAFAAGLTSRDAVVATTQGAIDTLNRDELQGVVAHEFSHVLNGDMRLNLRLIGIVNGLLLLAVIGRQLLRVRASGGSRKGGNPLPLIGLGLLVVGGIGVFFGRLIKGAVARQREYLADAAAVQFTRNPLGLASALKKAGGFTEGTRLQTAKAEQASHLFFCNGLTPSWLRWFSTHPPLVERIRALDPQFDGVFEHLRPGGEAGAESPDDFLASAMEAANEGGRIRMPLATALAAGSLACKASATRPQHLQYAANFLERLNPALAQAAHDPLPAAALTLALLLSRDEALRRRQLASLERQVPPEFYAVLPPLVPAVEAVDRAERLPLVMLALQALRQLSPSQYEVFAGMLEELVASDQEIDLFEYALQRLVRRHLAPQFTTAPSAMTTQYYTPQPLLPEIEVIVSALARYGVNDETMAAACFRAGAAGFKEIGHVLRLCQPEECGLDRVDRALDQLALASPAIKRRTLDAGARVVAADGVIQPHQAELLRAVADALDCPIPPFIEGV